MQLRARTVVNAAGLQAPALATRFAGLAPQHVPQAHFAKGHYFTLAGRSPFSRLIYPVPEAAGLGVHLTIDLGGQAKFGPDVQWVDAPDEYTVDPARADASPWPAGRRSRAPTGASLCLLVQRAVSRLAIRARRSRLAGSARTRRHGSPSA